VRRARREGGRERGRGGEEEDGGQSSFLGIDQPVGKRGREGGREGWKEGGW